MLSFINGLVFEFERQHGFRPNVVYLSGSHLDHLRRNLEGVVVPGGLSRILGMEMVVTSDIVHPHVAWVEQRWSRIAAV
jgi:hypothetical protein